MDYTLELSDNLVISENISRSGDTLKISFTDSLLISVELTSAYYIRRAGDTAFVRTNYP